MPDAVDMNFVTSDVGLGEWLQWADEFSDVTDMVDQIIANLEPGQKIGRLVIAGHGADHTTGFFVFDPDTAGAEVIDATYPNRMFGANVEEQLARLRPYFDPNEGVVEFRVCESGTGTNGDIFTQRLADIVGVPVTAPTDSISSLAAVGGVTTDWKTAYPSYTGLPIQTGFWRGQGMPRTPDAADIAPVTGATVPLREVPTTPTPAAPTPAPTTGGSRSIGSIVVPAVVALAVGAVIWLTSSGDDDPDPAAASPTVPAASPSPAASPTAEASASPSPEASAAPNRPPRVEELRAVLAVPVTTYSVTATDPDGDVLTFTWSLAGETCGTPGLPYTSEPSSSTQQTWSHSSDAPDNCSHETTDHDVTVGLTIEDGRGASIQCVLSGSGTQEFDPETACLD